MSRLRPIFFSIILIFSAADVALAQQTSEAAFGSRAAMIPRSDADTGILFDEYRLEKAAHDYFNEARFSGTNAVKTHRQIELEAFNGINRMKNDAAFKVQGSSAWQPIASSKDGHKTGRVRAIAFDPTNPKIVYIGGASGGIWKTMDIDARPIQWVNLSDRLPTVNFGAIAVNPKRPNIVYAGTGESQGDNYLEPAGSGIFKSVDGGYNWDTVATTALAGNVCSQIVIDPINTDTIYVASDNGSGILKSMDGGKTWKKISVGVSPLSIAIDPINTNRLYVSGFAKIFASTNYGENWIQTKTGLPTSSLGRITIAVSPSSPNTIYASIGNGSTRKTLGMWVSDDFGANWRMTNNGTTSFIGAQQEWCNSLAVHPTSAKRIFVGGLDIYQSNDSGKTMNKISDWTAQPTSSSFVHADIHLLVFNGTTLYACTDGGIAKTASPFTQWSTDINYGLPMLQFVGVDADKEFTYVTGGCQDNGTNRALIYDKEFIETKGGDGGHAWVSQEQPNVAYTTYVYTVFSQSLDTAKTWSSNLITKDNNPGLFNDGLGNGTGEGSPFYTAYDCSADGSFIVLGGNGYIWVSNSGGQDGFPNKSNIGIGGSRAINVSRKDPSFAWATSGSTVYRTIDQGGTWIKGAVLTGGGTITGITSNPNDATQVFAVTSGGGANKHYWVSNDGGVTFSTPAKNFPDITCWCIAVHPTDGRVFIGTEKGVLFSMDHGVNWYPAMNGFPNVLVSQLHVRGANNDKLLAGTYGRGMHWIDLTTLGTNSNSSSSIPLSLDPAYPNPVISSGATMNYTLKGAGLATITLHDLLGRELRILEKSFMNAGRHELTLSTINLAKGTYFVLLTSGGKSVSRQIVIE